MTTTVRSPSPSAVTRRPWRLPGLGLLGTLALTFFVMFPIVWITLSAFKNEADVRTTKIFFEPTFENFRIIFDRFEFASMLWNSLVVCVGVTVVTVPLATLGAYSLARYPIPFKRALLVTILATQFFPPVVLVLPYFTLFRDLSLLDTYTALILINLTRTIPFCIWLMYGFFDGLPKEIEQAARVDGASEWAVVRRVVAPLARPGIVTSSIFAFILAWNEFLYAFLIGTRNTRTAIVGLVNTVGERDVMWEQMSAAGIFVMIPMLVMAFAIRRYFVDGITMGAVK